MCFKIFFSYFKAGASTIAGVALNVIQNNEDGTFSLEEFEKRIRGDHLYEPVTKLAIVENTQNVCGGKVMPLEWLDEFASICRKNNVKMHMDGARVFHAAEYLNVPVSRVARDFHSITFCLSKSLCAPVGSILVGSKEFIGNCRRIRKALGGGMRQVGVLAAAGLVAFKEIVPKLGDDHRHTKQIAQAVYDMNSPYYTVDIDNVQTNICMIKTLLPKKYPPKYLMERLETITVKEKSDGITDESGNGILVKTFARDDWNSIRFVLYHHISDDLTELAIKKIKYCISELE